jgi:alkylhydroperoxidase/carboxymuconolactone decarboxylase family protein YurZ
VTSDSRAAEIRSEFERVHGTWDDSWQAVLDLDPEFLAAYSGFAGVPKRQRHLDDKTQAFIGLTVDAATTHLHGPGIRRHIEAALAAGATRQEVMEVLECTATLAIHAMNVGVPVLVEVLAEKGIRTEPAPLDAEQERIKADFTRQRGYWNPTWDEMLELTPELFEAYTAFSSHPWLHGTLSPKMREFIYIAFDTSATHLYRVGLKLHIENALGYGATPQEILEVMEIASVIGMQTVTTGAPILRDLTS